MTILLPSTAPTVRLPPLKLPPIFASSADGSSFDPCQPMLYPPCDEEQHYPTNHKLMTSVGALLPPIMTASIPIPNSSSTRTTSSTSSNSSSSAFFSSSPPYCSSSSSVSSTFCSSSPSSPDSVSDTSFSQQFQYYQGQPTAAGTDDDEGDEFEGVHSRKRKKKGSIQSLLNSGSELLALEKEDILNGYYYNRNDNNNNHNNNINTNNGIVTPKKKKVKRTTSPTVRNNNNKQQQNRPIKGLRLFSKQVCDKVAAKGVTTHNEVADEMAAEYQQEQHGATTVDQKNIRRRVYDALNVLMALDIIAKDRKQIRWLGIDSNTTTTTTTNKTASKDTYHQIEQEIRQEEERQRKLKESILHSKQVIDTTMKKLAHIESLISRNQQYTPAPQDTNARLQLPFFMVSSEEPIHATHFNEREASLHLTSPWTMYQDSDIIRNLCL